MYRHIAAGIWVAVQRLYVFGAAVAMHLAGYDSADPTQQKMNFGDGAILGAIVTVTLAEVAVRVSNTKKLEPVAGKNE